MNTINHMIQRWLSTSSICVKIDDIVTFLLKTFLSRLGGNKIAQRYFYEPWVRRNIKLKKEHIILDVGTHYGEHSLIWAQTAGLVICFEPDPHSCRILKRNAKILKINNLIIIKKALGSTSCPNTLFYPENMTLIKKSSKTTKNLEVELIRLDDMKNLIRQIKRMDWIKIDVEGYEVEVIKGAIFSLKTFKPNILIEVHPPRQKNLHYISFLLHPLGYKTKLLRRGSHASHYLFTIRE